MTTPPAAYDFVFQCPIIPVIVVTELEQAVPMAEALVAGGMTTLEITLRTDQALAAIQRIANDVPQALVGAGTVCTAAQFDAAREAGAQFIVSPGSSPALFERSQHTGVPLLPGAVTATEVMNAQAAGFTVTKFFPASTSGGAGAIKALQGPFGNQWFIPTGGITIDTMADYLGLQHVPAVGGSWMLPADAIAAGDWQRVTDLTRAAIAKAASITAA